MSTKEINKHLLHKENLSRKTKTLFTMILVAALHACRFNVASMIFKLSKQREILNEELFVEIETETLEFKKSTGELKEAHEVGRIAISYTDKKTVLNQLELTAGDVLLNAGKALFSDDIV